MRRLLVFALTLSTTGTASAAELSVVERDSIFAIVTHKAGAFSGKAHNHLVAAGSYAARFAASADDPGDTVFELELAAADLVVDAPELQQAWYPRLEALGILDEPFGEVSDKDRGKIRESMLGKGQLDAERFPRIRARVTGVAEEASKLGETEMPFKVSLAFEVHGKAVERPVAARASWDEDGSLRLEAAGVFNFTDFGIEPYSAFLGAVKNQDVFHVYVSLRAVPEAGVQ
ncbi:MAG TPA: YceI family protein [Thermoanaerobaculia bacterium]|jgi:hypothetical protein